jgi:hypothetical protein
LVDSIGRAAERLQLFVDIRRESAALLELTAYTTTLAMNYLTRRSFVPRPRRSAGRAPRAVSTRKGEETHGETADRDRAPA